MRHFILTTLLITKLISFGQTNQVVHFYGTGLFQYTHPVQVGNNEYEAYYQNMGETYDGGRIILDTVNKTFTIKWLNGDDWIAKYTKRKKVSDVNPTSDSEEEMTYIGSWTDDNNLCELTVKKSAAGCTFQVKSGKIVDDEYKIDAWKKIFTLFT